jgi:hypothetical protein
MRVFVLVPTYKAFLEWCSMRHVNPKAAICVMDPTTLRGQLEPGDQVIDARFITPPSVALVA